MHRPLTDAERHDLTALDLLLDPLLRCDLLVIASPVWNFGAPWRLKQWIDCVAQPGKTFRYSMEGSRGLLSCSAALLATLGGARSPDDANSLFLEQMGATMSLLGAETAAQIVADSLDVDPSQTESRMAAACAVAKQAGAGLRA